MPTLNDKLRVLSAIAARFNAAHITYAVGASALLYFKGLLDDFHDLDLEVSEADALRARDFLCELGTLHASTRGQYETKYFFEFTVDGVEVDLMGGFAIVRDGVVYDCSLDPAEINDTVAVNGVAVPLHSLTAWRRYYALMGRAAKAALIDRAEQEVPHAH